MGAEDALIVIESSDFECPFCSRCPYDEAAREELDVRVVFKHNPLSFHKRALPMIASMAAHEQGKFWEYHDLLFAKRFSDNDLKGGTATRAICLGSRQTCRTRGCVRSTSRSKTMVSGGLGRLLFINGKLLSGAKPLRAFQAEVDAARLEAKNLHPPGQQDALVKAVFSTNVNPSFAASLVDGSPVTGRTPPKRPQKKPTAVDSKPVEIEIDSSDPVQGKEDAKVTVAIFSDFECPFCSKLVPTMERIREEYGEDVRFVFKQHPLSFHKNARLAAKASLAANQQGKFWEYHVLFANQQRSNEIVIGYADQLGLDREVHCAHGLSRGRGGS